MLRILTALILVAQTPAFAESLSVDTKASSVEWVGAKVTGSHTGQVPVTEGSIEVDKGAIQKAKVTVDLSKMTNKDLTGEYHTKLLNHLKSDDFFAVSKHPTANIVINSAKKLSGKQYQFTGDLTIKGVTKPVSFKGDVTDANGTLKVNGNLSFDRTAYGIKYNSGKFFQSLGDKLINDEVKLTFTMVAKK
ncbi:MAG: YceI family protein [Bdellovibrionales bacterium]|nr:YceI family protein [Bdellovibrionales bacterium]